MPDSPEKKQTKWKAADNDLTGIKPKKSQAPDADDSQHPQHLGRPGVGKGGRNIQLEQLDAIMDAPLWTSQPKGSHSLNPTLPINPVAPELPHKGRGSHSKADFIYYSQTMAQKKTVTPPLSVKTPIIPPGTEPDLQLLNNSFVAAAKPKATRVASNTSQCQLPVNTSNTAGGHLTTSGGPLPQTAVLRTASTTSADAHFYHSLDPALWPTGPQLMESESSDSSEGDSSSDDGSEDKPIGWRAVGGHHSMHPGFSGEVQQPQPKVVSTLPTDFQFQFSHDKDDQVAKKTFAVNGNSSNSSLMDNRNSPETNTGKSKVNVQAVKGAAKSKEVEGPNATQLCWYGPHWRSFLQDAKGGCHVQQALENPFLKLVNNLPVSIMESLSALLIQWLKNSRQVEADMLFFPLRYHTNPRHLPDVWPAHKPDMVRLLYDDLAMWCSDLKKVAIAIIPSTYNLVPPATIPVQEHAAWVQNTTTGFLDGSMFLHDGVDELGKTKNFAHPGLHEATILFLYTGSYCIAHRRPDIFQKEIPLTCLALVCTTFNCVFDGLIKNRNSKSFLKFTAKEYEPIYKAMLKLLNDVMDNPYHGPRLIRGPISMISAKTHTEKNDAIGYVLEASDLSALLLLIGNSSKVCFLDVPTWSTVVLGLGEQKGG
ncbi:uncharacterized protein BJ212DRAFT_1300303 [Suillus subaureus]|uniref:DUF6532 domain-containing protein n=1 Tax=Suillus subaureus TaxID=48587 RepID=A0A9P7JCY6_9AGAM|nr:uncharacterized protein BJ212DRAFT_1300303 [Suillus subaureus]KAG1815127.1 hypothetical protein BJ212DRAFT_1300303 [Suillus subaureus]